MTTPAIGTTHKILKPIKSTYSGQPKPGMFKEFAVCVVGYAPAGKVIVKFKNGSIQAVPLTELHADKP